MVTKLHPTAAKLLVEVEAYCSRAGIAASTFGAQAMGNANFVRRLKAGHQPRLETIDRVRAFINRKTKAVIK